LPYSEIDTVTYSSQEKFTMRNLDTFKVLGIYEMSSGGITGTVVDLRLIFSAALKANATNIMMFHNHPSGRPLASEADKYITRKVYQAGKILDIELMDHLIITSDSYYSFTNDGTL
jgi:DNA repair protein RadC